MKRWFLLLALLCALPARAGEVCSTNVLQTCSSGSGSGSGTVTGPGAACTDNALPRWDGATTTALQCSDIIVTDAEAVTGVTTLTGVDLVGSTSSCGGGALDAENSVCFRSNEIRAEGPAVDAAELTLALSVGIVDHTLTIQSETTSEGVSLFSDDNLINIGGAGTAGSLRFHGTAGTIAGEGATANAFETTIAFGDATADATATFLGHAGGVQLTLGAGTAALTPINFGTSGWYQPTGGTIAMSSVGQIGSTAFTATTLDMRSDTCMSWMSTATPVPGTRDVGLCRSAAGVVKTTAGLSGYGSLETGGFVLDRTITAGGTTGAQTINKVAGTVNFAAAATTLVVTNSTVTANSICSVQARTNDTTCSVKDYEPAAGSFTIRMTAACTAETSVGFVCFN